MWKTHMLKSRKKEQLEGSLGENVDISLSVSQLCANNEPEGEAPRRKR